MKHFTCDKCGMPMDENKVIINNTAYDICPSCENKIFEGLKGKGKYIPGEDLKKIRFPFRDY